MTDSELKDAAALAWALHEAARKAEHYQRQGAQARVVMAIALGAALAALVLPEQAHAAVKAWWVFLVVALGAFLMFRESNRQAARAWRIGSTLWVAERKDYPLSGEGVLELAEGFPPHLFAYYQERIRAL